MDSKTLHDLGNREHEHFGRPSEDNWVLGSFQGNFSILLLENELYLKQNNWKVPKIQSFSGTSAYRHNPFLT